MWTEKAEIRKSFVIYKGNNTIILSGNYRFARHFD